MNIDELSVDMSDGDDSDVEGGEFKRTGKEGNFTPEGRMAAKTGNQEYSGNSTGGEIENMASFVTSSVDIA
eukprot:13635976-Ditylum_brightwellii.AAC.2